MAFSSGTVTIGTNTKKSNYDTLLANTQYNKATRDNDVTLVGTKTFNSGTVFNASAIFNSSTVFNATATLFDSVRRITSANYLHAVTTQDVVFDKLAPFIPDTGNEMLMAGMLGGGGVNSGLSRAERTSSTEITLYYIVVGNLGTLVVTNGSASAITISSSW